MNWEDCQKFFEPDGSLIDLYVKAAGLAGWSEFLVIARETGAKLTADGELRPFPTSAKEIFVLTSTAAVTLSMNWDGLMINAHFFSQDDIEVDLDPREVNSSKRFNSLIAFMRRLADATNQTAMLTPESCPDKPFLEVVPGSKEIKIQKQIDGTQHSA